MHLEKRMSAQANQELTTGMLAIQPAINFVSEVCDDHIRQGWKQH